MDMITLNRPIEVEPLRPWITHRTRSRFASLVTSCGLTSIEAARFDERIARGFFEDPDAGLVLTATSCDRPLFYPECEVLSQFLSKDLVLMRFDSLEGASFDVLLEGSQTWLFNYLAWRRDGGALWLVPAHTAGPFFRLSKEGLDAFQGAPYENGSQRNAGIIRTVDLPSFEGRF